MRERLSLPRGHGEPVQPIDVLPAKERDQLLDFKQEMLLSGEEAAGVPEGGLEDMCYVDPVLEQNSRVPPIHRGYSVALWASQTPRRCRLAVLL